VIVLLLRLSWMRQRGLVLQFIRSLRQPARLFGALAVAAGVGFVVWVSLGGPEGRASATELPRESLLLLCSMLFAMAVIGGFAQEGPRFAPADVDFLFPARSRGGSCCSGGCCSCGRRRWSPPDSSVSPSGSGCRIRVASWSRWRCCS
jgi:hypothetical protein